MLGFFFFACLLACGYSAKSVFFHALDHVFFYLKLLFALNASYLLDIYIFISSTIIYLVGQYASIQLEDTKANKS